MDQKQIIQLIYLYRKHSLLWNLKDHEHYDSKKRLRCWKKIAKEIPFTISELKKKMRSLLGSYRREKSLERRSRINGSRYIYKSGWYGIEHFEKDLGLGDEDTFRLQDDPLMSQNKKVKLRKGKPKSADLRPTNGKKYSIRPLPHLLRVREKDSSPEEAILDNASEVVLELSSEDDACPSVDEETADVKPNGGCDENGLRTKNKSRKDDLANVMIAQSSEILNNTVNPEDPYKSFGAYIATELRKYDQKTLFRVKNCIIRVIHDADIGMYEANEAEECLLGI